MNENEKAKEFIRKWLDSVDLKKYLLDAFLQMEGNRQIDEAFCYRFSDEQFEKLKEKRKPIKYEILKLN